MSHAEDREQEPQQNRESCGRLSGKIAGDGEERWRGLKDVGNVEDDGE